MTVAQAQRGRDRTPEDLVSDPSSERTVSPPLLVLERLPGRDSSTAVEWSKVAPWVRSC